MVRVHRCALAILAAFVALVVGGTAAAERESNQPFFGGYDWYMYIAPAVGIDLGDAKNADPSGGAQISAGFRFNRWISAEVAGEWMQGFSYDRGSGANTCVGDSRASNRYTTWNVTAGGRLFATEAQIQPYLLAHGGLIQTRDAGGGKNCQALGFATRLGAGIDLFVTNEIALSLIGTYVLPVTGDTKDHDYVSIGLGLTWY